MQRPSGVRRHSSPSSSPEDDGGPSPSSYPYSHLTYTQYTTSAALGVAIDGYVAEILRDHPNGLHYKDIALRNGVNADKLGALVSGILLCHIEC